MKSEKMKVLNPHSAGIDVGSRSHFVGIGQGVQDVKEFGVYSSDHDKMIAYLNEHKITTIAMESTGSYWQTLFFRLQQAGFEVLLVSGQQTKNIRAKTDVKDCQWIQKLHRLGLLKSCFQPEEETKRARILHRHRSSLVEESAKMTNKMQKCLRMMNLRLDVVLSDITGKSGIAIIKAILKGERSGKVLAQLANNRVRKSKEEIADALQGQWSDELLYELNDCYDLYNTLQDKILKCDTEIEHLLTSFTEDSVHTIEKKHLTVKQVKGKNQPKFDLSWLSYKYYGVDLFAIEGVSVSTVMTLVAEIGQGIHKFQTAKQFTSFLRLAPNNRISGGKLISSRTPKGGNKFAFALRNAANTIDRKKEGNLTAFFKRIAYKKGRGAAITATARKMAVIIWNMITKKEEYQPLDNLVYKKLIKHKTIAYINKKMKSMGIVTSELSMT
jgi:transposase